MFERFDLPSNGHEVVRSSHKIFTGSLALAAQMSTDMAYSEKDFPHQELTRAIIGHFFDVYNELGRGYSEAVYRNGLCVRLRKHGIAVEREVPFSVILDGVDIGTYRTDIICDGKVLVEVKAGDLLPVSAYAQVLNYLAVTRLRVALLLHFGPRAFVKRMAPRDSASMTLCEDL